VTEDELRDLGERTQTIMQMVEQIGWDLFVDRAKAEIQKHELRILGGRLEPAEYQREAGWVQGALFILGLPQEAWNQYLAARARFDEERQRDEALEGAPV
jgi:hypothetical protein